jgi:Ni/Co efflux regulator RcnB
MKTLLMTALAAVALGAAPAAALAKDGPKKPHPHGMPPGQAKKMWNQGERLPPIYLQQRYHVYEPARYSLPPAPYGYRYVRVGDRIYLAQDETGLIRDVITALIR